MARGLDDLGYQATESCWGLLTRRVKESGDGPVAMSTGEVALTIATRAGRLPGVPNPLHPTVRTLS
jgi:hypothetical protein